MNQSTESENAFVSFPTWSSISYALAFTLLLLPKINLITVGGESAGLRIDDLLLCAAFLIIVTFAILSLRFRFGSVEASFLRLVIWWGLSNVFNMVLFHRSSILYTLRELEYLVFFYLGLLAARKDSIQRIRNLSVAIIVFNGLAILLQKIGWLGAFSSEGFVASATGRPPGLTGGPWEIGAMLNLALALLLFRCISRSARFLPWVYIAACTFLLAITGARTPTFAHLFIVIMYVYKRIHSKVLFLLVSSSLLAALLVPLIFIPSQIQERTLTALSFENIYLLPEIYEALPTPNSTDPVTADIQNDLTSDDTDQSLLLRVVKWVFVAKVWQQNGTNYLIGVGPGTWGPAIDGGWLRILTESGLVGLVLYLVFLKRLSRIHFSMFICAACIALNLTTIDIHLSYKTTAYLLFAAGLLVGDSSELRQLKLANRARQRA